MREGVLASYLLGYDGAKEETTKALNLSEPFSVRFDVPPEEAIDYFKRKRIVTKETFNKLEEEAKAASFYVSKIYREDILNAFKFEITDALESGKTQKTVLKEFKDILSGAGHPELGDFHLETIVRNNLQMSYAVGRRKAFEEVADDLPIWEYSAVNDDRTRPTHRALDGIQYPANHEFWDTYFPPIGHNCRCTIIAVPEYRENYDHKRPNEDTTLIFDKDGLPEKAEYLTRVYDLKANNFVGVQKNATLETALMKANEASKDAKLLNHLYIPQVVVDKAKEIRKEKIENLIGWDKNGELVGHFKGNKDSVFYPKQLEKKMENGFDLHNHPPEGTRYFEAPSDFDFEQMVELKTKVLYTVTQNYLYQVRVPKNGWSKNAVKDFDTLYDKTRAKIAIDLSKKFRLNELTKEDIQDLENHLIWKEVAKLMKFKYKRFKISDL